MEINFNSPYLQTSCIFVVPFLLFTFLRCTTSFCENICDRTTAKKKKQRTYILDELLQSEINYVNGLEFVSTHFVQPLIDAGDTSTADLVFNSWLPITKLHQDFLSKLRIACLEQKETEKVPRGTVTATRLACQEFRAFAPFLRLYIPFVEKYNAAISRISNDLRTNGNISKQIDITKARQDIANNKLNGGLAPMLALPFQRLCKYGLLLRELSSTFDAKSRTGLKCCQAMKDVNDIVLKVNNAKARGENGERLLELQTALSDDPMSHIPVQLRLPLNKPLLQPSRRLLNESNGATIFLQALPMDNANSFDRADMIAGVYLILFSDILLIVTRDPPTKRKDEKMVLLHCIELTALKLIQKEEKEKVVKVDKDKRIRTILEVDRKRPWSKLGIGVVWKDSGSEVAFKETLRYELMKL